MVGTFIAYEHCVLFHDVCVYSVFLVVEFIRLNVGCSDYMYGFHSGVRLNEMKCTPHSKNLHEKTKAKWNFIGFWLSIINHFACVWFVVFTFKHHCVRCFVLICSKNDTTCDSTFLN